MRKNEPLYEDPWYLLPDIIREEADLQVHLVKQALLDHDIKKAESHIAKIKKLTTLMKVYNDYNNESSGKATQE